MSIRFELSYLKTAETKLTESENLWFFFLLRDGISYMQHEDYERGVWLYKGFEITWSVSIKEIMCQVNSLKPNLNRLVDLLVHIISFKWSTLWASTI